MTNTTREHDNQGADRTTEREFTTAAVVSAVRGVLLCKIDAVYEVLSFLVGRSVFTHEIPVAGRLVRPTVYAQHPWLEAVQTDHITPENWQDALAAIETAHGATVTLSPMGWNKLADASPIEMLTELVGEDRVIVVEGGADD